MALCMPWKGKSLYDMVNNKPDLYLFPFALSVDICPCG